MKGITRALRTAVGSGLAVIATAALSNVVWATIATTAGDMSQIAPPPSVLLHQLESDTTQFAFEERQCVLLTSNLRVNVSQPGTYDGTVDLTPGIIPAGTRVSSHFIQADKVGTGDKIELEGTLTTNAPILGLIFTHPRLDASDFLGAVGTAYPTGLSGRALQLRGGDFLILDAGLKSVTVHTVNSAHADQLRVVTACELPPPPPPPGGVHGCTPGYWKQDHHFDSWQIYSPSDSFNSVFGVSGPFANSLTLLDALLQGGGGVNALGRHAVAALLSSVHSSVDYGLTEAQVIAMTKAALDGNNPTQTEATKNQLAALNEKGCPLR